MAAICMKTGGSIVRKQQLETERQRVHTLVAAQWRDAWHEVTQESMHIVDLMAQRLLHSQAIPNSGRKSLDEVLD